MYDVLRQVAEALSSGMGVNVAPLSALLTTQEAADYLGISRPTLVRILERGEIPMEKPGRHRFVRLKDLVEYQDQAKGRRRAALEAQPSPRTTTSTPRRIAQPRLLGDVWRFRRSSILACCSARR